MIAENPPRRHWAAIGTGVALLLVTAAVSLTSRLASPQQLSMGDMIGYFAALLKADECCVNGCTPLVCMRIFIIAGSIIGGAIVICVCEIKTWTRTWCRSKTRQAMDKMSEPSSFSTRGRFFQLHRI